MKAPIKIVSEEEFQKWLAPRQQKNAGARTPAAVAMPSPTKAVSLTGPSSRNNL